MHKKSLKGVAGHTYGVTKNLLELFLRIVVKMKVCIVDNSLTLTSIR